MKFCIIGLLSLGSLLGVTGTDQTVTAPTPTETAALEANLEWMSGAASHIDYCNGILGSAPSLPFCPGGYDETCKNAAYTSWETAEEIITDTACDAATEAAEEYDDAMDTRDALFAIWQAANDAALAAALADCQNLPWWEIQACENAEKGYYQGLLNDETDDYNADIAGYGADYEDALDAVDAQYDSDTASNDATFLIAVAICCDD